MRGGRERERVKGRKNGETGGGGKGEKPCGRTGNRRGIFEVLRQVLLEVLLDRDREREREGGVSEPGALVVFFSVPGRPDGVSVVED